MKHLDLTFFMQQATATINSLIRRYFNPNSPEELSFRKTRKVLASFAESNGSSFEQLLLQQVFTPRGEVSEELQTFLEGPKAKLTSSYQTETRSRLKRFAHDLVQNATHKDAPEKQNLSLPAFLQPLTDLLTREGRGKFNIRKTPDQLPEYRKLPFNENSSYLLQAIQTVIQQEQITSLDTLFIHRGKIQKTIRMNGTPSRLVNKVLCILPAVFPKLGYQEKQVRISLPLTQWPVALQGEWQKVKEMVRKDNPIAIDQILKVEARNYKYKFPSVKPITIANYENGIGTLLGAIEFPPELTFEDLIKVQEEVIKTEGGKKRIVYSNPYLDAFRAQEQTKQTEAKNLGFDSSIFKQAHMGIIMAAKCLQLGEHIELFRKAYRVCLDEKAKEKRKARKKEAFPLEWVDRQVRMLFNQLKEVVQRGTFKTPTNKNAQQEVAEILFSVNFIVLRFMGYRQQCLVNARLDANIIFQKDGSILLFFPKEMMKNEKAVRFVVNEELRATHGILLDTLTLYYKKVYPFLYRKDSENISKHFFLAPDHGKVSPFTGERHFGASFKYHQREFLALDEINPADRDLLHPHYLRGSCADWLRAGLGMTSDKVGVYIGDDGQTVKKEYFDKEFVHDATDAIEQANIDLKARQQASQPQGDFSKTIQALERVIEDLRKQLARESKVQDRMQKENEEQGKIIARLSEELTQMRIELKLQRQQNEQLMKLFSQNVDTPEKTSKSAT